MNFYGKNPRRGKRSTAGSSGIFSHTRRFSLFLSGRTSGGLGEREAAGGRGRRASWALGIARATPLAGGGAGWRCWASPQGPVREAPGEAQARARAAARWLRPAPAGQAPTSGPRKSGLCGQLESSLTCLPLSLPMSPVGAWQLSRGVCVCPRRPRPQCPQHPLPACPHAAGTSSVRPRPAPHTPGGLRTRCPTSGRFCLFT